VEAKRAAKASRTCFLRAAFPASSGDAQFIAGYFEGAQVFGVEYTPIVGGSPSLFQGGAAFPGNHWTVDTKGEAYLARIPAQSHKALGRLRASHLRFTRDVLRKLEHDGDDGEDDDDGHDRGRLRREVSEIRCR